MSKKGFAVVEFEYPDNATLEDAKEFFKDLQWTGGCLDPEDPMFDSFCRINVLHIRKLTRDINLKNINITLAWKGGP